MEYTLNVGEWNKVFAVPSSVVDKYLKLASGNSLKLLLYLLRHGGETFTEQRLKEDLGFSEFGELEDAALFWVQRGIISTDNGKDTVELTAKAELTPTSDLQNSEIISISEQSPTVKKVVKPLKPTIVSNGEIAEAMNNSPKMKMLFDETEKMFGRPLKGNEQQTIYQLSEHYGLPCEVSLMLVKYCVKIGKATPSYISKVGEDWANDDIMTVQLADEKLRALEKQSGIEQKIGQAMGLSSNLSANNRNFIKIWAIDWGFSEEMIMLAYNKTIDNTGKWSFNYAHKILENWKKSGISTPQDAEKSDEEFKKSNSFSKHPLPKKQKVATMAGKSSSFDTNKLRSKVMNKYNNNNN